MELSRIYLVFFFGFLFWQQTSDLPTDIEQERRDDNPFSADFDMQALGHCISERRWVGETALFHRSTRTLLVTDSVLKVGNNPPISL